MARATLLITAAALLAGCAALTPRSAVMMRCGSRPQLRALRLQGGSSEEDEEVAGNAESDCDPAADDPDEDSEGEAPEVEEPVTPEQVYAPELAPSAEEEERWEVHEAFVADGDYDAPTPEAARRVVYRVTLWVPRSLGVADDDVPSPTAELFVDVSQDRLRARFAGSWPVPAGSEVRLRRDEPGVYVFDGEGGRSLGPGQLAQWFEGGRLRMEPGFLP